MFQVYICAALYCIWPLNVILYSIWNYKAKKWMRQDGYEWSGGYDAYASCLLLWAIFLPPVGTFFLVYSLFTRSTR
jgi:hypothetical protein